MAKKRDAHVIHDSCCNCRYWGRLGDSEQQPAEDVLGECFRYPPSVIGLSDASELIQVSPSVEARFCCGEHARVVN